MVKFEIFNLIEEQAIVSFTGKINLMSKTDQRHIGSIFMIDGKPIPVEEKTASGIIIPDASKEKPLKGKVVAVGPGKVDEPMTVKSGDTVLYGQYSGTEVKLDGTNYLIMREADVFGILKPHAPADITVSK